MSTKTKGWLDFRRVKEGIMYNYTRPEQSAMEQKWTDECLVPLGYNNAFEFIHCRKKSDDEKAKLFNEWSDMFKQGKFNPALKLKATKKVMAKKAPATKKVMAKKAPATKKVMAKKAPATKKVMAQRGASLDDLSFMESRQRDYQTNQDDIRAKLEKLRKLKLEIAEIESSLEKRISLSTAKARRASSLAKARAKREKDRNDSPLEIMKGCWAYDSPKSHQKFIARVIVEDTYETEGEKGGKIVICSNTRGNFEYKVFKLSDAHEWAKQLLEGEYQIDEYTHLGYARNELGQVLCHFLK
jgi:hypothetical protein